MGMKIKIAVGVLAGFALGVIATTCWFQYALMHFAVIPKEIELASQAGMDAVVLADLRLNETSNAIQELESRMDSTVAAMAQWDQIAAPDEKTRKDRDRWLSVVKMYHESYPVREDCAVLVTPFLATIPGRNPKSTCNSSICRLNALHHATTNAPSITPATGAPPRH